ncbi:hypothetical protein ACFU8W_26145 [Streptomyces sp. NPDC057565]|uniref:hypothetical protein n=1 Tax=Streptomyces sp. NPDC057565 TaxID=3346169 RepID=UPI00367AFF25
MDHPRTVARRDSGPLARPAPVHPRRARGVRRCLPAQRSAVPLDNALADAGSPARIAGPAAVRERFEDAWIAWHAVRAVPCTGALALLLRASFLAARRRPQESAYLASAAGSSASR